MDESNYSFEKGVGLDQNRESQDVSHESQPEMSAEDEKIQCNIERMEVIRKKVDQLMTFFDYKHPHDKPGIFIVRHQKEFFYPKYEWEKIRELYQKLTPLLSDLAENPAVKYHSKNHLDHILGNSPYSKMAYADRSVMKLTKEGGDISSKERHILESKETMDLMLSYLDIIECNNDILRDEIETEDGWLGKFKYFYRKETQDGKIILAHMNFLMRLEGKIGSGIKIGGIERYAEAITAENFDQEFDNLLGNEFLEKEKIKNHYFIGSKQDEAVLAA